MRKFREEGSFRWICRIFYELIPHEKVVLSSRGQLQDQCCLGNPAKMAGWGAGVGMLLKHPDSGGVEGKQAKPKTTKKILILHFLLKG